MKSVLMFTAGSRRDAMKILWVNFGGLLPLDMGGKIRSFHIVRD